MSTSISGDPPWLSRARRRVAAWRGRGIGPRWLVAVSGGGDSVGLLLALHRLAPEFGLELVVAHLDHGARGEEARADARFVAGLAESLGLPFDLGAWRPERPTHFEADARAARYAWLRETARNREAQAIAVGHTRDDQAETILHRIARGTGIRGLAGIPSVRRLETGLSLVRPLLGVGRDEIRAFLAERGQPCREDPTNADLSRARARIRHDLLPKLSAEYNPAASAALVRLGRHAAGAERATRRLARSLAREAVERDPDRDAILLKRAVLAKAPSYLAAEVVRLAWRRAGWPEGGMTERRWRRLARPDATGRFDAGCGIEVTADPASPLVVLRRTIALSEESPAAPPFQGHLVITLDPAEPRDETVDLDRIKGTCQARPALPGDRFAPLGMGGRSMPLADFFRGRGVAREARGRVPLVCDDEGIVWVVGHRLADRARLTEATARPAGLRWEEEIPATG